MFRKKKDISFRISPFKLLYTTFLFLGAAAVAGYLAQGKAIWQTLRQGEWWWLACAFSLQLAFFVNQSALYAAAYRVVGLREGIGHLFLLVMASAFVAAVAPGGTLSGTGLMIYDARRKELDVARAILANFIFFLCDYLAFLIVLFLGLLYLFLQGNLQRYELVATAILLALVLLLASALFIVALRPEIFLRISCQMALLAGRLPLGKAGQNWDEKIEAFLSSLSTTLKNISWSRPAMLRAAGHALLMEAIGLLQLQALFLAFHQNPGLGRLITGYAVGVLFMIVSITPQGVGLMEGAMTAAYTSLGIPLDQAVLVTFIYRIFSLWLPMLGGFIFFNWVLARW
ncbi:lysylphosphatidylglycerol synthase transmembrane domain-containing protein [Moorella naiadis]|uniref:lysylphosphatidylglycerol synthase transmembrane domain-containing protein n=1 Tax=Moorella naiadis (nom. illeg.) TaxID=3093670 RepID=UPI003D9C7E9E